MINIDLCHSVKSKTSINLQCINKPKNNEIFCGIHLNCKNVILYQPIIYENNSKMEIEDDILIQQKENDNKPIYTKEELFEIISNDDYISIYSLRKSIKSNGLNKIIDTKQSKNILTNLLKSLIEKERYYYSNLSYIIFIQSYFRKWLVYRRALCSNDTDILTFNCKYEIPGKYFFIFYDQITHKKYAYDIRTLIQIIESNYKTCPYTFRAFTENEILNINKYKNKLLINNIDLGIEKKILSFEEETEMKIKDLFYQINMLDNYTNHLWFQNLDLHQLIELYLRMEDLWNYRSSMDMESKKKIVQHGIIFNIPPNIIKMQKSKIKMQNVLLTDFLKMINEGINRDEKKLGAILILTGLVEVSYDAAIALPHLVQI